VAGGIHRKAIALAGVNDISVAASNRLEYIVTMQSVGWLSSRVVSVLDSAAEGPGYKSQSRRCWVTVLGKLFTPIVPLFTKQQMVAALLRVAGVTAGLAKSNGSRPAGL